MHVGDPKKFQLALLLQDLQTEAITSPLEEEFSEPSQKYATPTIRHQSPVGKISPLSTPPKAPTQKRRVKIKVVSR